MEAKYRAWLIRECQIVSVQTISLIGEMVMVTTSSTASNLDGLNLINSADDPRFILMQSTGLHDRDGREIFVGDIIDIHDTVNGQSRFLLTMGKVGLVPVYDYDRSRKYEYNVGDLLDADSGGDTDLEVVGNLYEGERE